MQFYLLDNTQLSVRSKKKNEMRKLLLWYALSYSVSKLVNLILLLAISMVHFLMLLMKNVYENEGKNYLLKFLPLDMLTFLLICDCPLECSIPLSSFMRESSFLICSPIDQTFFWMGSSQDN